MTIRPVLLALVLIAHHSGFAVAQDPGSTGPWGPQPQMTPPTERKSPAQLPFRSWQLQTYDASAREREGKRIKEIITAAEDFGVNNIQLSHQLVMFAHQLLKKPDDIKLFNECIKLAHSKGISVHIWTHEFGGIPDEIKKEEKWFDKQPVWDLLESRYSELFKAMPDLDGVVLTFHETEIMVFNVESDMPLAERVAKLINSMHSVCKKHKKTLVVRTFAYEPAQIEGITKAFKMVDPEIILMTKCVPHDWQVFYPHNPAIGRHPDRMQVIEFDPGAEYYGEGKVPYLYPEYLDFRLRYARERNTHGYVARIERQWDNPCALGGRNEMNLYALKRLAEDPAVTPDQIWKEYFTTKAGEGAYLEPLIEAMKLTDDVLNRCYFMLGCWYNNHSDLPKSGYASSRIKRIVKWNPIYKELVSRLDKPDARTVGEVFRESAESVALAKLALSKLEEAKNSGLPKQVYDDYKSQLSDLLETAETWAKHRNAYIQERSRGVVPSDDGPFPIGGPPRLKRK
jgi:hypothetical protein